MGLPVWFQTAGLLVLSNIFMTFAWYGHLKNLNNRAWYIAALVSWGIALFEYLLQGRGMPRRRTASATRSSAWPSSRSCRKRSRSACSYPSPCST